MKKSRGIGKRGKKRKLSKEMTLNKKLCIYLNEALAMENKAVERLQSRVRETRVTEAKQQLQLHLEETREQQNRLKQLISSLGETPTKDKGKLPFSSPSRAITNMISKSQTAAERELKAAREDAIIENCEIIIYDMLMQLAQKMNVGKTIPILTQNLEEERSMADWIRANTPVLLTELWPEIEVSFVRDDGDVNAVTSPISDTASS